MSEEKDKPVLDEQTLAKLLEAAYVLQEHNRELQGMELGLELKRDQIRGDRALRLHRPSTPRNRTQRPEAELPTADYTFTLAKIVETQHQIQVRHLELESAMSLVAERLIQNRPCQRRCDWHARRQELPLPRSVWQPDCCLREPMFPWRRRSASACLRTGQVFRCADVNPESLLDTEECRRRGIQSMIAVPVFHDGGVAGGSSSTTPLLRPSPSRMFTLANSWPDW